MTAPAPTARATPTGSMLQNGYQTLVTFAVDDDVSLWERQVTPPGYEGGEPIDTTTMHNTTYKTKALQALIEVMQGGMVCGYDPAIGFTVLEALVNVNTTITVTMPDGSSWAFFGGLRSVIPSAHSNGVLPECTCVFEITSIDPASGDEEGPVYTAAP